MTFAVMAAPSAPYFSIDVLNDLFTLVARGQIKINVRPFAAALAQESLEEQFHADRIDGGNFERVTDGGVCREPRPCTRIPFCWQ